MEKIFRDLGVFEHFPLDLKKFRALMRSVSYYLLPSCPICCIVNFVSQDLSKKNVSRSTNMQNVPAKDLDFSVGNIYQLRMCADGSAVPTESISQFSPCMRCPSCCVSFSLWVLYIDSTSTIILSRVNKISLDYDAAHYCCKILERRNFRIGNLGLQIQVHLK